MDKFSTAKRSLIMSKVFGKEAKPEVFARKYPFAQGFRYRKNVNDLPGKPDVVLPKHKTIVLINGCFWHGHKNCKKFSLPTTNVEFWKNKVERNIIRDIENIEKLAKWDIK